MKEQFNLEEGEYICDKCGGTGRINNHNPYHSFPHSRSRTVFCPMCQGTGKLDWIENIVGKKPVIFHFENALEAMSQRISKEIDKEIISSVIKAAKEDKMEV